MALVENDKIEKKFRVNRKKHFLTYSCPVDCDENPIPSKEYILEFMKQVGEIDRYSIGCELHENGKKHYHVAIDFVDKVETENCRYLDLCGVHPNWILCKPRHWRYTQKFGDFIATEIVDIWGEATRKRTAQEAIDFLWEKQPQEMVKYGHNIERNLRRRIDTVSKPALRWYGPYLPQAIQNWKPDEQTLVVVGPVGRGKTQWAKYFAEHSGKRWCYVKNSIEALKHQWKPGVELVIYDDIGIEKYQNSSGAGKHDDWGDVFDITDGGSINFRGGSEFQMPPGVWKMWLTNPDRWNSLLDPGGRVLNGRRSFVMDYRDCVGKCTFIN